MPTLSITVDNAQAARIAAAYGDKLRILDPANPNAPPQPATMPQIRAFLVAELKRTVREYETRIAHAAVVEPTDLITD
jgi:hypothetical protein